MGGGATDNLLLAGPKGGFLRCAFYYVCECVYANASESVCFFLPVFSSPVLGETGTHRPRHTVGPVV